MTTRNYTFEFEPRFKDLWLQHGGYTRKVGYLRHGYVWNDAERRHLYAGYYTEGLTVSQLAARHQRGAAGIVGQLNSIPECRREGPLQAQLHQHGEIKLHNFTSPFKFKDPMAGCAAGQAAQQTSNTPQAGTNTGRITKQPELERRPYADVIVAWAQGRKVQSRLWDGPWYEYTDACIFSIGHPQYAWRVAPVKTALRFYVTEKDGVVTASPSDKTPGVLPALVLTFEGGNLAAAGVELKP